MYSRSNCLVKSCGRSISATKRLVVKIKNPIVKILNGLKRGNNSLSKRILRAKNKAISMTMSIQNKKS